MLNHSKSKLQKQGQSESLWNLAIQSGWSTLEVKILKLVVMKYGVGKWVDMYRSQVLPTKQIGLCYLQLQRVMGQQSLSGFLGLHVDIDRVYEDNCRKKGNRKQGFLVNDGDKLTKEQKIEMKNANQIKYGLSKAYVNHLKIPDSCNVKVYELDKILNGRKKLTTCEKIQHLLDVKDALDLRRNVINSGHKIIEFDYMTPQQFARDNGITNDYLGTKLDYQQLQELKRINSQDEKIEDSDVDEQLDSEPTITHRKLISNGFVQPKQIENPEDHQIIGNTKIKILNKIDQEQKLQKINLLADKTKPKLAQIFLPKPVTKPTRPKRQASNSTALIPSSPSHPLTIILDKYKLAIYEQSQCTTAASTQPNLNKRKRKISSKKKKAMHIDQDEEWNE